VFPILTAPSADTAVAEASPQHDGPLSGLLYWLRRWRRGDEGDLRQELEELLEEHEQEEPIDPHERRLLSNILKLHTLTAAEIMVPRADIVALAEDTPFEEATKQMVEHGHSRVPVYRDTLDDVVGMLHVKDMMPYAVDRRTVPLGQIVRKLLFVAPSAPVLDLLLQMRLSRVHMALVIDEFGGIDGLVTIEDVIEQIVGEIEDEHDDADQPKIIARPDGSIIADARTPLEALEGRVIPTRLMEELEEEVTTLGGLVTTLAGRVPARGEIIRHPSGLEVEVLDADPRRVKRLRVRTTSPAEEKGAQA
jgi:hemolysin (HlyC) family protein